MSKSADRLNKLIEMVKSETKLNVSYLAEYFNVTEMTIYNDLKKIKDENIILSKKDIVYTGNNILFDYPHYRRLEQFSKKKEIIAKKAIEYIKSYDTIFIDGSSTAHYLSKLLALRKDISRITVITYSPVISIELSKNPEINVICQGGRLERVNLIFLSPSEIFSNGININKAFISSFGISEKTGFTEMIEEEAEIKKKLISICPEINILADTSKFKKVGTYTFAELYIAKRIIVDNLLALKGKREFESIKKIIE